MTWPKRCKKCISMHKSDWSQSRFRFPYMQDNASHVRGRADAHKVSPSMRLRQTCLSWEDGCTGVRFVLNKRRFLFRSIWCSYFFILPELKGSRGPSIHPWKKRRYVASTSSWRNCSRRKSYGCLDFLGIIYHIWLHRYSVLNSSLIFWASPPQLICLTIVDFRAI